MKKVLAMLLFMMSTAAAQGQTPPSVYGIPTMRAPLPTKFVIHGPAGPMLRVELARDGEIHIDWEGVERNAVWDPIIENNVVAAAAIARLMIAIRDGTWRTLVEEVPAVIPPTPPPPITPPGG